MRNGLTMVAALAMAAAGGGAVPVAAGGQDAAADGRCMALANAMTGKWPEAGTRIANAAHRDAADALPAHCDLVGILHERTGVDGQHYAIRFHLRLPAQWNGRLFFQGGGGSNGELGDAIGRLSGGAAPALAQGYAVLSQDSGHDNATNNLPDRGGVLSFGFDPQARADYGGASLAPVTRAARALIAQFYGELPRRSYFVGCSKGGQEGMALAQRHPELYDGIVAAAPGFSLPRAAIAEAWDTQSFAGVARANGAPMTTASLAQSFSAADFGLVRQGIVDACDADDGLKDGIIGAFARCTTRKVMAALAPKTCRAAKQDGCLSGAQLDALRRTHEGPHDARGRPVYAGFPWDAGWGDMGWRIWKTGVAERNIPAINVLMGAPALASVFTVPPTAVAGNPEAALAFALAFDTRAQASAIYATGGAFERSAWQDVGARSPDLAAFARRGGKMIVPQGVSDPVFSIDDTLAWWREVNARQGNAARFVRVFPVPGMGHCAGGPATDQFDALAALVDWVEKGKAPDRIEAAAGPGSPWPGRTRPLCPYPQIAVRRAGAGEGDTADAFQCAKR